MGIRLGVGSSAEDWVGALRFKVFDSTATLEIAEILNCIHTCSTMSIVHSHHIPVSVGSFGDNGQSSDQTVIFCLEISILDFFVSITKGLVDVTIRSQLTIIRVYAGLRVFLKVRHPNKLSGVHLNTKIDG